MFRSYSLLAILIVFTWSGLAFSAAPVGALKDLEVYPKQIKLDGPRSQQRVGVLGVFPNQKWELSSKAKYRCEDEKIATVDETGIVRPMGDGETQLLVEYGGKTITVPITVANARTDSLVDFTKEIVPILTRVGCNQGACHGAQHGRGGFKLSLLGFDAEFDYAQIVQSAEGRRVVLSEPDRSILLLKPALVMEHGGGERFAVNSREYDRIRRWLEDGCPAPKRDDAVVTNLEVWPEQRIMVKDETQQILVKATWSDGLVEDVTATAQFDSLNEGVATVTSSGLVSANNKGETHIMVRFAGQATVAQVTLPYAKLDKAPIYKINNFIDRHMLAKWHDLGLTPSELCSDTEFLRRIHLDTIGTLPSPELIKSFLEDKSPDKRQKAIETVLNRPEFIDFWALKWGDLLRINRTLLQDRGMWSFHNWIRASVRDEKPINKMVREIITAEGSTFTEGPANYYMTSRTPADWAETTSQLFLGVRIGCAKCHHHPFEKWSQDDYYGMTAFFVRLGTKNSQEFGLFGREQVVYLKDAGEQRHPRKGGVVKPQPLDGKEMDDPLDRRVKLAQWITQKENPFFARNIVNRFWGYYMGRGLVEPLDDMRQTNPACIPELLDALSEDFVQNDYNLKHLLRTIMNSRVYQLSSKSNEGNRVDASNTFFTRFTVRRLTAEQLADAIDFATGTETKYTGLPAGTRAIQLPDPEIASFFLDTFGRPARQITCECERTVQPNIAQALHLLNGEFLNGKLAAGSGRINEMLKNKKSASEIVETLYLATLSRPPRDDEMSRATFWISNAPNIREGSQDLLWALLNSREFMFNY